MINLYNYILYRFSVVISNIFIFKTVSVYNFLINFSIGKYKYSKYGIKLLNQSNFENTYKFCLGAAYGYYYSNYLIKIKKKFVFLDIGANIGLYSCLASKNNNCEFIYAFEPVKKINNIAKKNFILNNVNGYALDVGIYKKNTMKHIFFNPLHTGMSSLLKKNNKNFKNKIACKFINYKKLNKVLTNRPINYLVKIDVEGLEKIVLKELIKSKMFNFVSSIFIEISNPKDLIFLKNKLKKFKFNLIGPFNKQFTKDYLFLRQ